MDIKRAKTEIKNSIKAYLATDEYGEYLIPSVRQRPILLMGPPGIGKTQIMEQIAREEKIGLVAYTITHHTRQSAIGLPFIREKTYGARTYSVTEYTMSEIISSVYDKIEQTGMKEGILFIDEINCVSETLAPTMLQFLQCKTFGNQSIPEGWIIAAAGNPPEYNKSVRDFDIVTLDRIKKIDVEANYEVWKAYAYKADVHPAILAYLEIRKENFYKVETTVDGKMFVTARGWEDLSSLLNAYEVIGKRADREVVYQYIQHWKIAKDFANYLELYEKYKKDYQLDRILRGTYGRELVELLKFASFDEKLSVVGMTIGELTDIFKQCYLTERYVLRLYDYLSKYKQTNQMKETIGQAVSEYEGLRKAEQLTQKEDYIFRKVISSLEMYETELKKGHLKQEEGLAKVQEFFKKEVEKRETGIGIAKESLDYAFDFMEEAFGDGQEMVSFVTELNSNFYSIQFLKENDCDKYHMYNKKLLLEERHEEILKGLDEIEEGLNNRTL